MMSVRKQIGANIRRLRLAQRTSQCTLARAARMSAACLSKIENGKQNLSIGSLERLATALGVAAGDLVARISDGREPRNLPRGKNARHG